MLLKIFVALCAAVAICNGCSCYYESEDQKMCSLADAQDGWFGEVMVGPSHCIHKNPQDAQADRGCNFGDRVIALEVIRIIKDENGYHGTPQLPDETGFTPPFLPTRPVPVTPDETGFTPPTPPVPVTPDETGFTPPRPVTPDETGFTPPVPVTPDETGFTPPRPPVTPDETGFTFTPPVPVTPDETGFTGFRKPVAHVKNLLIKGARFLPPPPPRGRLIMNLHTPGNSGLCGVSPGPGRYIIGAFGKTSERKLRGLLCKFISFREPTPEKTREIEGTISNCKRIPPPTLPVPMPEPVPTTQS